MSASTRRDAEALLDEPGSGYLHWEFSAYSEVALGNAANGLLKSEMKIYCFGPSFRGIIVEVLHTILFCPPTCRTLHTQIGRRFFISIHGIHLNRTGNELGSAVCAGVSERVVDVFLAFGGS